MMLARAFRRQSIRKIDLVLSCIEEGGLCFCIYGLFERIHKLSNEYLVRLPIS